MNLNPFKAAKRDLPTEKVHITETGRAYTPPREYLDSNKVREDRKTFRESVFGKKLMGIEASAG